MKQKLKEGDVVMVLPHTSHYTERYIGSVGIIRNNILGVCYAVEIDHCDLPFNLLSRERWAFDPSELLKIGTL